MPRCFLSHAAGGLCGAALLGMALVTGGCGTGAAARPLSVLRWSGMGDEGVVLDHPIEILFDRDLDPGLRLGAVAVIGPDGAPATGFRMEVRGRRLQLHPQLPRAPDLSDGSLLPDTEYHVLLRGVPHLASISVVDGSALVGDRVLRLRTLPASAPEVLTGYAARGGYFSLDLPRGGMWLEAAVGEDGLVTIGTPEPIDPRTLREPAQLRVWDPEQQAIARHPVPLRLVSNSHENGAVLECRVPPLPRAAALELPETLNAIGGRALVEGDRTLRLSGTP